MARNPRSRAQRQTAARVRQFRETKQYEKVLPKSITSRAIRTREDYLQGVLSGQIPEPASGSDEEKSLASAASKARWGKADPRYEAAWSKFWYHHRESSNPNEDEEYRDDDGDDEDEE